MHSFSITSANIAINDISLKTRLFGLHFRRWLYRSIFDHFDRPLKLPNSAKKTQHNGHYAVQGHSRSPILVPIESPHATWLMSSAKYAGAKPDSNWCVSRCLSNNMSIISMAPYHGDRFNGAVHRTLKMPKIKQSVIDNGQRYVPQFSVVILWNLFYTQHDYGGLRHICCLPSPCDQNISTTIFEYQEISCTQLTRYGTTRVSSAFSMKFRTFSRGRLFTSSTSSVKICTTRQNIQHIRRWQAQTYANSRYIREFPTT